MRLPAGTASRVTSRTMLAAPARESTSRSATSIARALVTVGLLTPNRRASSVSDGSAAPGLKSPASIWARSSLAICSAALARWTGMVDFLRPLLVVSRLLGNPVDKQPQYLQSWLLG